MSDSDVIKHYGATAAQPNLLTPIGNEPSDKLSTMTHDPLTKQGLDYAQPSIYHGQSSTD